jgi:hypothetical protein
MPVVLRMLGGLIGRLQVTHFLLLDIYSPQPASPADQSEPLQELARLSPMPGVLSFAEELRMQAEGQLRLNLLLPAADP